MSLTDHIDQLESRIGGRVGQVIRDLRAELRRRIDEGQQELLRQVEEMTSELPGSLITEEDLEPVAARARGGARREAYGSLLTALRALDRAGGQAELLNALLAEGARFADRTALWLTRTDGARVWGSHGWGDAEQAVGALTAGYDEEPWGRLVAAHGVVSLDSAEAAALGSRLETAVPRQAVLVPLVLRDRLAAALYADRMDEGEVEVEPLMALAWAAALALEGLAFRERASTSTLVRADAAEASAAALPLWDAGPGAADGAGAAEEGVEHDEEEAAAPLAAEPAFDEMGAEEEEEAEAEPAPEESELEDVAAGPWSLDEELPAEPAAAPAPAWEPLPDWGDAEPETEPADEAVEAAEAGEPEPAPAVEGWPEPSDAADAAEPDEPAEAEVSAAPDEPAEPYTGEAYAAELDTALEPLASGAETTAFEALSEPEPEPEPEAEPWPEVEVPEPEPPESEPETAAGPVAVEPPPGPGADAVGAETLLVDRSRLPGAEEPPAEEPEDEREQTRPGLTSTPPPAAAAEPAAASADSASPQVTPPSDVEGPGWAFSSSSPSAGEDDAAHEEARRLARLLVSEIRLYNEEQVEEGRRQRDLYDRLRDDIERSRQMYEERIDDRVRDTTDYFDQELVRILAAGDPDAMRR